MRPKETYTKEEYNQVRQRLLIMTDKYNHAQQELNNANDYIKYLPTCDCGRGSREVERLIAEDNKKRKIEELLVRYPYYKKVKDCVESGITEVSHIVHLIGKSKSAVYRALHDLDLMPLEKKGKSNMRLNI